MKLELSRKKVGVTFEIANSFLNDGVLGTKTAMVKVVDNKSAIIKSTNGEIGFTGNIELENADDKGEFLLPMEKFMRLLKDLPFDKFYLVSEKDKNILKGKKFRYKIPIEDTELQYLDTKNIKNSFVVNSKKFGEFLKKVMVAALKDTTKRNLNCVYIEIGKEETNIVATDALRMNYKFLETKNNFSGFKEDVEVLIPLSTVKNILPLLENDSGKVKVELYENLVKFVFENGFEAVSRIIDESYPNYESVAQINMNDYEIILGKSQLFRALKRILAVSDKSICNFSVEDKKLILFNEETSGQGNEEIEIINKDNIKKELALYIPYIMDVLKVIDTDEIVLRFSDRELSPLAIKEYNGDDNIVYVVMPIRK